MSKINRSSSQLFHKRQTSDQQINSRIPKEMEERLIRKTAQLFAKNQSRILFPQANTPNKNQSQLTRNKSLSYSKSKLFQKARQVDKNETFQKPFFAQTSNNFAASSSNFQYSEYKNTSSQLKLNEIAQRKLIISKVITNNEQNKSKLTLRGELLKSQLQKDNSKRLEEKRYHQLYENSIDYVPSKELTQSKQFQSQRANDYENNRYKGLQNNQSFNLSSSNLIDEERLRNYSRQLQTNIKQSIKKEMDQHFQVKEKQLEQRYLQKEKQYLQKFKQLQNVMESQLQKQRSILLSSIHDQLEKQLQKTQNIKKQQSKLQPYISTKARQEVFQPILKRQNSSKINSSSLSEEKELIKPNEDELSIKRINKQVTFDKNSHSQHNKRKDSINIPKQSKKVEQIKQIDGLDSLKEVKPVQRAKPAPSQVSSNQIKNTNKIANNLQEKNSTKPNRLLGQQNGKKSNSIYNEAQDSYLDQIQEVKLNLESKMSPEKHVNNLKDKYERVNQSFNVDKKLNDSFTSQKPVPVNKAPKPLVKKETEEEKRIARQEERKTLVRNQLKQQIKNDQNVIAIGQVAGYCSKYCKNSKVDWRVSSLLLYRYCFDFFRSFKKLYQQALDLNLIKKQELDRYSSYDEVMQQNLGKMYKSISKKVTLSNVYKEIIESQQLQLERLKPYALIQAKNYIKQLSKSNESKPNQGDPLVIQCGLRVINSVYIIKKLNGAPNVELIKADIEKLSEEQLYKLFSEWSSKLLKDQ